MLLLFSVQQAGLFIRKTSLHFATRLVGPTKDITYSSKLSLSFTHEHTSHTICSCVYSHSKCWKLIFSSYQPDLPFPAKPWTIVSPHRPSSDTAMVLKQLKHQELMTAITLVLQYHYIKQKITIYHHKCTPPGRKVLSLSSKSRKAILFRSFAHLVRFFSA